MPRRSMSPSTRSTHSSQVDAANGGDVADPAVRQPASACEQEPTGDGVGVPADENLWVVNVDAERLRVVLFLRRRRGTR